MSTLNNTSLSTPVLTAGQKAAATRKANQQRAILSARANKAVATRRANAAAARATNTAVVSQ